MKKEINKTENKSWENKCAEISSMVGGSRSRKLLPTIKALRRNSNERKK